ncbi:MULTISPECIES: ferritin-like domain-containing protein [Pseudomonas]|jgi:rubrerythrin|uniref:Ferritin-like domain-containing protein n=1 Tax=Serpens gallinarum TaxID=2763075 RepID=A0ABR8TKU8_9PSED|nr:MULTISPECIES: ferritin-like domain-containing protein [Pseudomonas]MBD7976403.1 ferritin-like domain-containing protein [Serpens gallinarum]MBF0675797.1 ferritin-like domain-containing protein [Pseudomonas sp.]
MATAAKLGSNLTGIQMSPKDTERLMEAVEQILPDVPGDDALLATERVKRNEEAERIGSVPIPGSAKGMLKSTFDMIKGKSPELLVDKLGERLAFERSGVRLYDAMIAKVKAMNVVGSDLVSVLQHIRDEEFEHMLLVEDAIKTLGADPTAQTPCADVAAVKSMGLMQVLTDPRTNVAQGLGALLTAELEDNAAWELLIELAEAGGHPNIAKSFEKAKTQEDDHLLKIKSMVRRDLINDIK